MQENWKIKKFKNIFFSLNMIITFNYKLYLYKNDIDKKMNIVFAFMIH